MTNRYRSISHLTLRRVKLSENSLHYLSKALTHLESMKLEGCKFLGYSNNNSNNNNSSDDNEDVRMAEISTQHSGYNYYDITMSKIDFKSMEITLLHQFDFSCIFVDVTLFNNVTREYYTIDADGKNALKINKNEFKAAVRSITDNSKMIMIDLVALSIETFKFSASSGVQFKLEF